MLKASNFYRPVALLVCGIFALVGSISYFLGGNGGTQPSPHRAAVELESSGVTNDSEPIFAIERNGDEKVSISGRLSHRSAERNSNAAIAAAIGVQSWESTQRERPGIDVALVFDVSGSMRGEPLRDVKMAAESFVKRLEDGDRVALIEYSSEARVVTSAVNVNPENQHILLREIRKLHVKGGTNISAGWELGRDQLEKSDAPIRRIVLLSDGQANAGITDLKTLGNMASTAMEFGISTTSLGVGLNYNEDLLQGMATRGGGNYYFAHDHGAARAFEDEVTRLEDSIASRARLRISTVPSLRVKQIEGFPWTQSRAGTIEVELGTVYADMRRDVLVEFAPTNVGSQISMNVELLTNDSDLVHKGWSSSVALADQATYNTDVLTRWQKIRTARALRAATVSYQQGQRESAVELLTDAVAANNEFVSTHDIAPEVFVRANAALSKLAEDVEAYEPSSTRGLYRIKGSKFNSANIAVDSNVRF